MRDSQKKQDQAEEHRQDLAAVLAQAQAQAQAQAEERILKAEALAEERIAKAEALAAQEQAGRVKAEALAAQEQAGRVKAEALAAQEQAGRVKAEALAEERKERIVRADAALEKALAEQEKAKLIPLSLYVETVSQITDVTNSSAHLNTDDKPAEVITLDQWKPQIKLPNGFWDTLALFDDERHVRSEADGTLRNVALIRAVLAGLGMEDVSVVPQLYNFDSHPDLTLVFCGNQVAGLSWEDKKAKGGAKTWKSNTPASGQVFEQLAVNSICLGRPVYGIQSTFNEVRLLSLDDFSELQPTPTIASAATASTHKKLQPVLRCNTIRRRGAKVVPLTKAVQDTEKGRNTRAQGMVPNRTLYASNVYSLGTLEAYQKLGKADEKEKQQYVEQNIQYVTLLATAIMFARESVESARRDVTEIPLRGPARVFSVNPSQIYNRGVELENGILFDLHPTNDCTFYAFKQIGHGASAVCCLATTSNAAACVLKIFKKKGEEGNKLAESEAQNWEMVYRGRWKFIKAHKIALLNFLVLPYFWLPTMKERESLAEGGQKSKLWEGLRRFAESGYSHNDIKWHHVGFIRVDDKKRRRDGSYGWHREVFLLDLGDIKNLLESNRAKWVKTTFDTLKKTIKEVE